MVYETIQAAMKSYQNEMIAKSMTFKAEKLVWRK